MRVAERTRSTSFIAHNIRERTRSDVGIGNSERRFWDLEGSCRESERSLSEKL
jgi:hypothetical protein